MKYVILTVWVLFLFSKATAEPPPQDTADNRALNASAEKWLFLNTDSSIYYGQQALLMARKMNLKHEEGISYYLLGGNYWIVGNYPKALAFILEALQIFEKLDERASIANTYRALASIYRDQSDFSNALFYAGKCRTIAGENILPDIYTITGSIYEKSGNLDSAAYYLKLAAEKDLQHNGKPHYGYIPLIFGNIDYKKKKNTSAIQDYHQSIQLLESQSVYKDLMEAYNGIADAYRALSVTDSAIYYAKKVLAIGQSTPFLLGELDTASTLYHVYLSQKEFDSTVRYMELSMSIRDSLNNQQKAREFQTLVFKEQLRQEEIERERSRAAAERKENIQLIAIAAFIPMFFLLVIILRRKQIKPGIIEFMVLVGLLLFFEFISLLIHPWLESRTHHIPILMLLALVLIAAILVPSHHRLEQILKKKLAKQVRAEVSLVSENLNAK